MSIQLYLVASCFVYPLIDCWSVYLSQIFLHKAPVSRSVFHLEDGPSISLLVVAAWPHNHSFPTEQENCQRDFVPGGCNAQSVSLYCDNGFVQDNQSNKDATFSFFPLEDSSSIMGLVRDEEPTDKSCRTAPEHLESSDIQTLIYNPSPSDTMENYNTYPGASTEGVKMLLAHEEPSRFFNNRTHPRSPHLETKESEMRRFPGYEFRPPILPCDSLELS